jgi:hypothetical protein
MPAMALLPRTYKMIMNYQYHKSADMRLEKALHVRRMCDACATHVRRM